MEPPIPFQDLNLLPFPLVVTNPTSGVSVCPAIHATGSSSANEAAKSGISLSAVKTTAGAANEVKPTPGSSPATLSTPSSTDASAIIAADNPSTSTSFFLKVPKVEPKHESYDEFFQTPQIQRKREPSSPSLTPEYLSDKQLAQIPVSVENYGHLPLQIDSFSEENNVYTEFRRISELFRSAFARRLKRSGCELLDPDSGAIVPVPKEKQVSSAVVRKRKYLQRSSELVRVTNLSVADQRYFREIVRRTRMVFDSIRILPIAEEEKSCEAEPPKRQRIRGDLRASSAMRGRGLWLNRDKRIVGSIPGVHIGDVFLSRMELCVVGLHGQVQAGIDYLAGSQSSNGEPIATSIVVSGGYEDDEDSGEKIIYTGHGGQGKFSKQCEHQKLEGGNLALERSMHYEIEVRVIRGIKHGGSLMSKLYVYDGLYRITDCWFDVGKSGFGVYKYQLLRIDGQPEMGSSILRFAETLRTKPLSVRPSGYFSLDISQKKENIPVLLFNDIDQNQEPLYFEYLPGTVFPPFAFHKSGIGTGCDCVSGCGDDCFCAMKNGGKFPYNQNGHLVRGKPIIFECGSFCKCPPNCQNRVTQKGLKHRLEVFRSRETGWGVRSLDLIHAGTFVCEYTGVAITREQAHILTMNGDTLVYPGRFSDRWAEWGDVAQVYSDYVRPSYPSVPPLDFAMDVSRMRNVACYISHSTTPNLLVQFVLYDHNNLMFPHLMLFAMENIPPLRELSLDYGVADEWTGKLAICN